MTIASFQYPNPEALNQTLVDSVYQHKLVDRGKRRNNELGGWHSTTQDLAERPGFPELLDFILESARTLTPVPLQLQYLWSIVNPPGVGNAAHPHEPGLLVACYYPQVPEPVPAIVFHFGDVVARLPPVPGQLLLFPGETVHSVETNLADTDRIVISMDFRLVAEDNLGSVPR